jgi:hypothetical protein
VILVSELTVKLVAGALPKLTAVAPVKLWPLIVAAVPPATRAADGETDPTPGCSTSWAIPRSFRPDLT